ncbi:MAG: class I SAM-dependent methyltransferase [Ginsengibacter sp.]
MKTFISVCIISFFSFFGACQAPVTRVTPEAQNDTIYIFGKSSGDGTGKYYLGREIAVVMGAAGASWLERDERQQEENTKLAIGKMNLSHNSVVADIGAGTGYYTFAISKKVPNGKVYAVDIQDEMIRYLNEKKNTGNVKNVEVIKGTEKSPILPDNSIDLTIMVDVYHELEYPHEMLQEIKKALKPEGKVLLLEYRAEDESIPIKPHHKMSVAQVNREMEANGFELAYAGEFLPIQHFLLYRKKN